MQTSHATSNKVPINDITIIAAESCINDIKILDSVICQETNAFVINYKILEDYIYYRLEPNNKLIGIKYKNKGTSVKNALINLSQSCIKQYLQNKQQGLLLLLDDDTVTLIEPEFKVVNTVHFELSDSQKSVTEEDITVIANFELTENVKKSRISRVFVSTVQNLRKQSGLKIWDKITVCYCTDMPLADDILKCVTDFLGYPPVYSEQHFDKIHTFTIYEMTVKVWLVTN
jgi:isoleucyl-tRNA synthetase